MYINNMRSNDLPFEITPQIVRYFKTMLDVDNKFFAQLTGDVFLMDTFAKEEEKNLKEESNIKSFWLYLLKENAIEDLSEWNPKNGITNWNFVKFNFIEGQRNIIGYPKKIKIRILDIEKINNLYIKTIQKERSNKKSELAEKYGVSVNDREIWINNKYLINKPHAVGSNMEFFSYIMENKNKEIRRNKLPDSVQKEIRGKGFSKIINALGFSGEILKAFFPKRGKGLLVFNQEISREELQKRGIKEKVFLKELELAHIKHSPK